MSDEKKCEACFRKGNEPRMRSVQPGQKILFRPCPQCGGTGKAPEKNSAQIWSKGLGSKP
jgi:DnaJ-class molecular chaperone